jgi:hypothetical protein
MAEKKPGCFLQLASLLKLSYGVSQQYNHYMPLHNIEQCIPPSNPDNHGNCNTD